MATRTQAREAVLGILYAYESGNDGILKLAPQMLQERKIRNKQQEFALGLASGVIENLSALDKQIQSHLREWDFTRLGRMERNILRLGGYEILYTQVDVAIVINESVLLAKHYGEDNAPALINGVLDSLGKASRR